MIEFDALARGRAAFDRHAWGDAFAQLSAADRDNPLSADDLERLAVTAYLVGRDADCDDASARAHVLWLASGNVPRAVRCAFWLAFGLLNRGELAPGGGWIARARRLLEDNELDCVEHGYLLLPLALQNIDEGDAANGHATFGQIVKFAERFHDLDLLAMARFGTGVALVRLGETGAGMAMFDEAMVSTSLGELSPIVTGLVYCGVIQECHAVFDVRRAQEWTAALTRWCEEQPDLVPYRGQCLVHRSQLLQLRGAWPEAMDEVRKARVRLSTPPGQPALGMAIHQQAELLRLRGEFADADAAYQEAGQYGHGTQPGLALLRLAQGHLEAAEIAIRICLNQTQNRHERANLLPAYVEIVLAAQNVGAARNAADELSDIATHPGMPLLQAMSARATGAVLLAEGNPEAALTALRQACTTWQEIEAPYELARTRELTSHVFRALGDLDAAQMEVYAADRSYQRLGALPDMSRLRGISPAAARGPEHGLSPREVHVLCLVAAGKSNRVIAAELTLSEHTVARHVQNILTKLDLSSRTAASAYAYEHGLIGPSRGQN